MKQLETLLIGLADIIWGNWLLVALVGLGVFYTCITSGVQVTRLPFLVKSLLKSGKRAKEQKDSAHTLTSLQALCTAVASCVGSGNIVGVSTAILAGGPGALFWMWVAAFFGMATKFGEIVLGICYRSRDAKGMYLGGPMYYIAAALKAPWLGIIAAGLLFIQNAGATLVQSNTISTVIKEAFNIPPLATGIILAAIMSFIISGGLKRLVTVAGKVVPLMAGLYVVGGLVVILANFTQIPSMLGSIFGNAFSTQAGVGALAGITVREAMRFGIARGLYSNEAGEGSAAVLHSSAEVDHPVRQGLYGIAEVFIDTMLICTTTGFVVIISGVNLTHASAATLSAEAFATVMPMMRYVVNISLVLFATTSLMSQWYFGHVSLTYLKLPRGATVYRFVFPIAVIFGSVSTIDMVWALQDCALGLLIIPNILALIALSGKVRKLTKEFFDPKNKYLES